MAGRAQLHSLPELGGTEALRPPRPAFALAAASLGPAAPPEGLATGGAGTDFTAGLAPPAAARAVGGGWGDGWPPADQPSCVESISRVAVLIATAPPPREPVAAVIERGASAPRSCGCCCCGGGLGVRADACTYTVERGGGADGPNAASRSLPSGKACTPCTVTVNGVTVAGGECGWNWCSGEWRWAGCCGAAAFAASVGRALESGTTAVGATDGTRARGGASGASAAVGAIRTERGSSTMGRVSSGGAAAADTATEYFKYVAGADCAGAADTTTVVAASGCDP